MSSNGRAPKFIELPRNVIAKVGKTAIIDCVVKGGSEYDVECEWYFERKLIKDEGRYRYLYEKDDVVGLEIRKVRVEDEGEYKCVAFNEHGKAESNCEVLVNAEGKIVDAPKDSCYEENQTATFKCRYDGNPRPEVKWFLGKKEIKNGGKYTISNKSQVSSLEIDDLTLKDKGTYSVVVSNDAGEDEVTFLLTVDPNERTSLPKEESIIVSSQLDVDQLQNHTNTRMFHLLKKKKERKGLPLERDGTKYENPEKYYEFVRDIRRGKFAVVREARCKVTGNTYAAKIIKYDADSSTVSCAIREHDLMASGKLRHESIPTLHETYVVRNYIILVMELCDGETLLENFANRGTYSEDDIVKVIKQLCDVLIELHSKNIAHLNICPSNIRFSALGNIKLLDFNSAIECPKQRGGVVADIIGHLEFCAPEMIEGDPVLPQSDMWSVGIIVYILCSGISPFYYENEDEIIIHIQKVIWRFDASAFTMITSQAKHFINGCLIRIPEMRYTAAEAMKHKWLSNDYEQVRKISVISVKDIIEETNKRLCLQDEDLNLEAALDFKMIDEEK